jgi:oxygen-independent coproporphyrinogen III oxidase
LRWSSACATLSRKAMRSLHYALAERFRIPSAAYFSAHVDPLAHHPDALATLRKLGARTIHIGAELARKHDKHTAALCRERTAALIASASEAGFTGIEVEYRIDTPERLGAPPHSALEALIAAGPTRIVLVDATPPNGSLMAHPPQLRAPAAFVNAAARLAHAGYVCIGESLFALATDPYSTAYRQGRLTCRAGGFATHPAGTVLGFGPGAIGQVGPFYYQNHRAPARYFAALDAGHLPIERGLHLSHDDLVRRAVIASLATNLFVDVPAIEAAYGIDFGQTFAAEWRQLRAYAKGGLLTMNNDGITLTEPGRLACSSICQVFDARARQLIERIPQTTLL